MGSWYYYGFHKKNVALRDQWYAEYAKKRSVEDAE